MYIIISIDPSDPSNMATSLTSALSARPLHSALRQCRAVDGIGVRVIAHCRSVMGSTDLRNGAAPRAPTAMTSVTLPHPPQAYRASSQTARASLGLGLDEPDPIALAGISASRKPHPACVLTFTKHCIRHGALDPIPLTIGASGGIHLAGTLILRASHHRTSLSPRLSASLDRRGEQAGNRPRPHPRPTSRRGVRRGGIQRIDRPA